MVLGFEYQVVRVYEVTGTGNLAAACTKNDNCNCEK